MIKFGNFGSDDLIQLAALIIGIMALIGWVFMMRRSTRPLYFIPPITSCSIIVLFYFAILFIPMTVETATSLSSVRSLIDVIMWGLSSLAMLLVSKYGGRV